MTVFPAKKQFSASPAEIEAARRTFDFLMPYKKSLFTTPEVCKVICRGRDYVRELIAQGRLESHADSAFGQQKSNTVTRRSVLVYLARTAQYDPSHFLDSIIDLLGTLTNEQLKHVIAADAKIRTDRP
jgi:hypothetical protein